LSDSNYAPGGLTVFWDSSSAGNSIIINNSGVGGASGTTEFDFNSTAARATLIANGGRIYFNDDSTGGQARVELFDGILDISPHSPPDLTVGSIEGEGSVFLGSLQLGLGSNNRSTVFSGIMTDGGSHGGAGGSLLKLGTSTLALVGANTYTGGTTVNGGELIANNMSGSATGAGPVQVNAGTLGGQGTIAGPVTIGRQGGSGAVLSPGRGGGKPGKPLTIQSTLAFNSDATYKCGLNTRGAFVEQVAADSVTINGALFSFVVGGHRVLSPGTVFTVIDNTAATQIAGTFSNLADGSTFTAGSNTFKANYEGGDGNDLTLTVQSP
jgi:autotransporter-associated beta strand protein